MWGINPLKLGYIILILIAGLAGSYLIVKNSNSNNSGDYVSVESPGKTAENSQKSPIQWISNLVSKKSDSKESGKELKSAEINELLADKDLNSVNLTDLIAQSSFTQMKKLDQSGKDPFSIDPNNPAGREFIEKAIAGIGDPSLLFNFTINDKDLKISQDNSLENKKKYIDNFGKIMLKNVNNNIYKNYNKAVMAAADGDVSGVKKLNNLYENFFNEIIDIFIPSDYLNIHKNYLAILKKMETIYRGLADFQNDPVKAALLIQLWPKAAGEEANFFQINKFN